MTNMRRMVPCLFRIKWQYISEHGMQYVEMMRKEESKMQNRQMNFIITGIWLLLFIVFTALVQLIDVAPIGPDGSSVGFASVNALVRDSLGAHKIWYTITEWLGFLPLFTAVIFAVIGLIQCIRRRSLFKVDTSIIFLGIFYMVTIMMYILFEVYIVNYRPILVEGKLEASYPSSHTMLACCFMAAAALECRVLIKKRGVNLFISLASVIIMVVMVAGRLASGAHWFTDIIGGLLISGALIMGLYSALTALCGRRQRAGSKGDQG